MTKIQWTEKTWNPVRGCVKVSPGCKHCYAETFAERFRGVPGHPYEQGFDVRLVPDKLQDPFGWKKPAMVFVNSMSDLFQVGVPFEFIDQVFAVMGFAHWHTFQVLTKRPERMREYMCTVTAPPLPNVWLGVSVENQKYADERIPLLLQTPAAVRFISAEPLLGPVDLSGASCGDGMPAVNMLTGADWCDPAIPGLDWVICGGESGPGARSLNIIWAESLLSQCQSAGVSFFMKQLGPSPFPLWKPDQPRMLHDRKGGDVEEWPPHLRVREFPKARTA